YSGTGNITGDLTNSGTLTLNDDLNFQGTNFTNQAGGNISAANNADKKINLKGSNMVFTNAGTLGKVNAQSTLTSFDNQAGGSITGDFTNISGNTITTFTNQGTINGTLTNQGTITNLTQSGTISNLLI
ncbi:hypothetical protein OQH60_08640, partial [Campylobacter sp. MIT 21-1685]|nr:hypothetical protein [Campylobacter sp. MIT 21-1685]